MLCFWQKRAVSKAIVDYHKKRGCSKRKKSIGNGSFLLMYRKNISKKGV